MHFSTPILLLASAALAVAQSSTTLSAPAATHTVIVGEKGNAFEPANITARVGDSVAFTFLSSSSHDVLQAEYARPCEARDAGALFSGDLSSKTANDQFIIRINDTNPLWYFCSVARHCQDGMVGVINPPQITVGGYSIEGWVAESKKTTVSNNTFVAKAQGGRFASSGKKGGSGGGSEDANATTTGEVPGASSSAGAAAGLAVKGGVVAGVGAFVAALVL